MRRAGFPRLAPRPLGAARCAAAAPRRTRAMLHSAPFASSPQILVTHDREKTAERKRDDRAGKRPAVMGNERFTNPLHQGRRQQPEDAADEEQPAEDGDENAPIACPNVMDVEHGEAKRERNNSRQIDQRRTVQKLIGHGAKVVAFEQEAYADHHQHRTQDARDEC